MLNKVSEFVFNHTPLFYWTQSLWRDEAFSVWIAQDGVIEAIRRTSGDFNPPLYYILLSFWMHVFGKSEIALRGFSVFTFLIFLFVVYKFGLIVFKSPRQSLITVALMALNSMLLYFAFELRMYSLLILFATLSMYFLYTKKWFWYIVTTSLGMYTQPFMAFIVLAQTMYLIWLKNLKQIVINSIFLSILYLPWLPTLIKQFQSSGPMWMYPVNLTTFATVLGNVFVGYEGTPGNLWIWTGLLSLILVIITVWLLLRAKQKKFVVLCVFWVYLPLIITLLISLAKPIYVHRYVIYTTVGEVFLLSVFVHQINNTSVKRLTIIGITTLLIIVNITAVSFHRKVNIRNTFNELQFILKSSDVIYAASPLVFYESLYYRPQDSPVFLYNPQWQIPPRYVGAIGMPENIWVTDFPVYPKRAFFILENGQHEIKSRF